MPQKPKSEKPPSQAVEMPSYTELEVAAQAFGATSIKLKDLLAARASYEKKHSGDTGSGAQQIEIDAFAGVEEEDAIVERLRRYEETLISDGAESSHGREHDPILVTELLIEFLGLPPRPTAEMWLQWVQNEVASTEGGYADFVDRFLATHPNLSHASVDDVLIIKIGVDFREQIKTQKERLAGLHQEFLDKH